jgi:ubiquinone/menaquinone biosynthesis C-methylase UbiE
MSPPAPGQSEPPAADLRDKKRDVQDFYDEVGWVQDGDGVFVDAALFEDLRDVASDYLHACHLRVGQHLPSRGRYLLDVASGPVQYPEYLTYSEQYEARICVDLSYAALRAAQRRLGDHGIYLLGDITNLPLQDGVVDAAVSLHTIYHVPADEQAQAFREVTRVVQSGGRAAVVYVWKNRWIRASLLPARIVQLPGRLLGKLLRAVQPHETPQPRPRLHFHAHSYRWFVEQNWPFQYKIRCWRSVTTPLTRCYVHRWLLGRVALRFLLRIEETFPETLGRIGAYPLIMIEKPASETAAAEVPRAA